MSSCFLTPSLRHPGIPAPQPDSLGRLSPWELHSPASPLSPRADRSSHRTQLRAAGKPCISRDSREKSPWLLAPKAWAVPTGPASPRSRPPTSIPTFPASDPSHTAFPTASALPNFSEEFSPLVRVMFEFVMLYALQTLEVDLRFLENWVVDRI